MNLKLETVKITFGSMTSAVLAILGKNYKLVILLITLIVVDTASGNLRAVIEGNWVSTKARKGLYSKLFELVLVALMYMCEWVFEIGWLVNAVVLYFSACEGASVLENIAHFNDNVPQEVISILQDAQKNAVSGLLKKIKDFIGGGEDDDNKGNGDS